MKETMSAAPAWEGEIPLSGAALIFIVQRGFYWIGHCGKRRERLLDQAQILLPLEDTEHCGVQSVRANSAGLDGL